MSPFCFHPHHHPWMRLSPYLSLFSSYYRHPGSFDIITVKDAQGHTFATRRQNVFVIGSGNKPLVSLPKGKGIKQSIIEERNARK